MRMNIKALAIALGVIWSASVLLVGLAHQLWPGYGLAFLDLAASLYPGFHPDGGWVAVIVGSLYALVDGAIGGAVIAWLYNTMAHGTKEPAAG